MKSYWQEIPAVPTQAAERKEKNTRRVALILAGSAVAVVAFLAIIEYVVTQWAERAAASDLANASAILAEAHQRKVEKAVEVYEQKIRDAIHEGRVIRFMNEYQVLQALGHPYRRRLGTQISDSEREVGVVERWEYDAHPYYTKVLFDIDGFVMGWQKTGEDTFTYYKSSR